jgi:blocked-early-in-transport protein 1
MASRNNRAAEDIVDAQNREYHDRLSSKASYLKSLAFDIENEAKDHHRLLNDMDDDFDSTSGFLGNTLKRVQVMAAAGKGNRKLMCYVSIFIVMTLFALYLMIRSLSSTSSTSP